MFLEKVTLQGLWLFLFPKTPQTGRRNKMQNANGSQNDAGELKITTALVKLNFGIASIAKQLVKTTYLKTTS